MIFNAICLCFALLSPAVDAAYLKNPSDTPKNVKRRGRTYQASDTDNNFHRFPVVRQQPQFHKRQEPTGTPFGFYEGLPHLDLGIGNSDPPQHTRVLLDTGSSELWVYTPALRDDGTYDPNLSTSEQCYLAPTFNITYLDGTDIDGFYCTEIIQVADLTVTNMTIGVPQTAVGDASGDYGILGLSFKTGQGPEEKHSTLVDAMFEEGLIPARAYGIFLNKAAQLIDMEHSDSENGEITFGGADLSLVVDEELSLLSMLKTEDPSEQQILTLLTAVNSNEVDVPVLLDTGTPISILPPEVLNALVEEFAFTESTDNPGMIEAPCSMANETTTGLTFTFTDSADAENQVTIMMPWSEAIRPAGDSACAFVFRAGDTYIMGQTFLQSTYLFVDLDEFTIGLGQANWV
ncbi:hypothetical protein LTR84_002530 [Exophiala bonariae]|uniref:Peptidase A1 domain-containing protein n=1 Tax=Exophiala bonariae TaxID=1690606 RepID=A0AAV9NAR8_9EURO|nr:hypothetical protein LTR84_002530 [Exophiala bonariae]